MARVADTAQRNKNEAFGRRGYRDCRPVKEEVGGSHPADEQNWTLEMSLCAIAELATARSSH